jgi:uncharacterized protein YbbC (DUF1343 family)
MTEITSPNRVVRYGADHLLAEHVDALANRRIGLVTNIAAVCNDARLTPTRLALQRAGLALTTLFSPEHGLGAGAADGARVADSRDALTGLPVHSLYGATQRPTTQMVRDLDLLLFDIPDIGTRYYTYIWTLSHLLEACAELELPLWVLDRPNPLGGDLALAEGPMLDEAQVSTFVGRWAIPVRHSLTAGELARLWNHERQIGADLTVVPAQGWQRTAQSPGLGLPFIPPSPSMPSYETALVYPGTCLFEGTNVSEGRGTSTPFRGIGAPWINGAALAATFNHWELPGIAARQAEFTPCSSKYAGEPCSGVMLHVTDAHAARPVAAGLYLLVSLLRLHPNEFSWLPYPTAVNAPGHGHFDRLIGRVDMREQLQALATGHADQVRAQIARWTAVPDWADRVQPHLLYD